MNNASDYISLSDNYAKKNREQELICLYQAKFYALKNSDQQSLDDVNTKINGLLSEGVSVPGTSIVILSYNTLDFTRQCLESIKNTISLDRCQVIVVDNDSKDGSLEYLRGLDWITLVENHENRGFPGGCNDGIAASEPGNDIYLLNSDTILLPNSLFWLKMGLYESEKVGSTGSMSNFSAGGQMIDREWRSTDEIISYGIKANVPMKYPYEYKMFLIGFSLLLKRSVLDEIGLLDERFNPGNSEDLDICFRILKSGRVNLLCHNSFVVHFGHKSFEELQKTGENYNSLLLKNDKILADKLGFNFWLYLNEIKKNAITHIPSIRELRLSILDIGCGMGSDACIIKTYFPNSEYIGVEEDKNKAVYAKAFGKVIIGKPEKIDFSKYISYKSIDYIIYSDKNERNKTEQILKKFKPFLKQDGTIVNDFQKPILSISMLCNGRHQDETQKCLASLQKIREQIATEIIIVDTGCDEKMREMISVYADQVIPFKWCDDFAKARNAGLKACTGEWFMYIDDDEWFEDSAPIADFFTSGEYRRYGYAAYEQRNYLDHSGNDYDTFWVYRLSRRTDELHFKGRIHEYLKPLSDESKLLNCYVNHYGYVYDNEKEHYAKAIRNIKPLREMIREEPENLHWYSQLAQEYMAIGEHGRLYDFSTRVIKALDKADEPGINKDRADFYFARLWSDNRMYQYEQTVNDFNTYRKDRRNNEICLAMLYFNVVTAYFELHDYKNAENYARKYMELYSKWREYDDFDMRIEEESSLTTKYVFSKRYAIPVLSILIASGIKLGEVDSLHEYFHVISDLGNNGGQFKLVFDAMIDAFIRFPFDERFVGYADIMLSYDKTADICSKYALKKDEEGADESGLIQVLGQTANGNNYYLHYLRLRYQADYAHDREKAAELLEALVLMTNDFFNLDQSVWRIAEDYNIDLKAIFEQIPFVKWYSSVDKYFDRHSGSETDGVRQMMSAFSDDEDIRFCFYRLKLNESELTHNKSTDTSPERLEDFSKDCIDFYKKIFQPSQFDGDIISSFLPRQCQFALYFLKAVNGNYQSGSEEMAAFGKCLGIYPVFDRYVHEYIEKIRENRKKIVFVLFSKEQWYGIRKLWEAVDKDMSSSTYVVVIPYYDKKADGTLGSYHCDKDQFPFECNAIHFSKIDLKKMQPDVIFIDDPMDGNNPKFAVPAEYYASKLQEYTKMLVYVPDQVLNKPGIGEHIYEQVKEQLERQ